MVATANDWDDWSDDSHLTVFPFAACRGWIGGGAISKLSRTKFEQIGTGDGWVGERRPLNLSGSPANGTNQDVCIRQIIRNQIGQPVWQILLLISIGFDSSVNEFEVFRALGFFLRGCLG